MIYQVFHRPSWNHCMDGPGARLNWRHVDRCATPVITQDPLQFGGVFGVSIPS